MPNLWKLSKTTLKNFYLFVAKTKNILN